MLKQLERKLICPQTEKKLQLDDSGSFFKVKDEDIKYMVEGNIIDFCGESESDGIGYNEYNDGIKSHIKDIENDFKLPNKFIDTLVEIPADRTFFSLEKYRKIKDTTILVVDKNLDFLKKQSKKAEELGLSNIYFLRSEFDKLPIAESVAGVVVSILGFSRIENKKEAMAQIHRALKVSGTILGAFFVDSSKEIIIEGSNKKLEAFQKKEDILKLLDNKFNIVGEKIINSKYLLDCRKKWPSCGVKW